MRRALAASLLVLAFSARASAQSDPAEPFDPNSIPEALRPWIEWVRTASGTLDCPPLAETTGGVHCVWAGALALDVGATSARFTQRF